jgi:hypothetical protein
MQERKIVPAPELLQRIRQLSCEADWSPEELQEALREGGVDPNHLVQRVLADVQRFLHAPDALADPRPLLVTLRQQTQLPPSAIAAAMAVPVPFLSMVSRHPRAVPVSWREELARRAERCFKIDQHVVVTSFAAPFQYDMAAARTTPYPTDTVRGYEDILARSGMDAEARQFWHSLAANALP